METPTRLTTWPAMQAALWARVGGTDISVARALSIHVNTARQWRVGFIVPELKRAPMLATALGVPVARVEAILRRERMIRYARRLVAPPMPPPPPTDGGYLVEDLLRIEPERPITRRRRARQRASGGRDSVELAKVA